MKRIGATGSIRGTTLPKKMTKLSEQKLMQRRFQTNRLMFCVQQF